MNFNTFNAVPINGAMVTVTLVVRKRGGGVGGWPGQRVFTISLTNANADDEEIIIAVAAAFVLIDK